MWWWMGLQYSGGCNNARLGLRPSMYGWWLMIGHHQSPAFPPIRKLRAVGRWVPAWAAPSALRQTLMPQMPLRAAASAAAPQAPRSSAASSSGPWTAMAMVMVKVVGRLKRLPSSPRLAPALMAAAAAAALQQQQLAAAAQQRPKLA